MLRATSASGSPPPPPYHRPCAPTVTLRSQWDGDTPGFIVDVEIPDWLPDSHVRISMLGIKQVVDCYHANGFTPSTALGSFMVLLGTNPSGASAEGGTLSCKIDGRFNASATTVRYVGSRCFANPPPPPVTFLPCSDASFAWPSSGGRWRGTVTLHRDWVPMREIRVDFGRGIPVDLGMIYNAKAVVRGNVATFQLGMESQFAMESNSDCPAPCKLDNQFAFDVREAPHEELPALLCEPLVRSPRRPPMQPPGNIPPATETRPPPPKSLASLRSLLSPSPLVAQMKPHLAVGQETDLNIILETENLEAGAFPIASPAPQLEKHSFAATDERFGSMEASATGASQTNGDASETVAARTRKWPTSWRTGSWWLSEALSNIIWENNLFILTGLCAFLVICRYRFLFLYSNVPVLPPVPIPSSHSPGTSESLSRGKKAGKRGRKDDNASQELVRLNNNFE